MGNTECFEYVGFWKRVLADLIDVFILVPLFYPINYILGPLGAAYRTVLPEIVSAVLWSAFHILLITRFGGTPGKLLLGIRIVDSHAEYLGFRRAIRRELFPNIVFSLLIILQVWVAYSSYPDSVPHSTAREVAALVQVYGQPFSNIAEYFVFAALADIGIILLNEKKRALHDFIAGSYVITRRSRRAHLDASGGEDSVETGVMTEAPENA